MEKKIKQPRTYDLLYYVGAKLVETVVNNKPIAICKWKQKQLETSTHTMGKFHLRLVTKVS